MVGVQREVTTANDGPEVDCGLLEAGKVGWIKGRHVAEGLQASSERFSVFIMDADGLVRVSFFLAGFVDLRVDWDCFRT